MIYFIIHNAPLNFIIWLIIWHGLTIWLYFETLNYIPHTLWPLVAEVNLELRVVSICANESNTDERSFQGTVLAMLWALFLAANKPKSCSALVEDPVKLAYCHNCWHPAPLSLCVERKMRRVSGQTEVRSITAHQRTHPVPLEMFDQFDSFKQHNDFCVFHVSPSASSPPHRTVHLYLMEPHCGGGYKHFLLQLCWPEYEEEV